MDIKIFVGKPAGPTFSEKVGHPLWRRYETVRISHVVDCAESEEQIDESA